ncbi:putative Ig domain-containing protein [Natronospora cellulosivora (SeqCode)]
MKKFIVLLLLCLFVFQFFVIAHEEDLSDSLISSQALTITEEGYPYKYQLRLNDLEIDNYQFSLEEATEGMTIDDEGLITWVPSSTQAGNYDISVIVTDQLGRRAIQEFSLIVAEAINNTPNIISSPVYNAIQGEEYVYNVIAEDLDGDDLIYSLFRAPDGMAIDQVSGKITWIPEQAGLAAVYVFVSDGKNSTLQYFRINIDHVNNPPEIVSVPAFEAEVGKRYVYNVQAIDYDNDHLIYSLEKLPIGMTINSNTGLIEWVPSEEQIGEHSVELIVSDGKETAIQNYIVSVNESLNHAPVITSIPPVEINAGEEYIYKVEAIDLDDDELLYSLRLAPDDMTINESTGEVFWGNTESGDYEIEIKVDDNKGGIASQNYILRVVEVIEPGLEIISIPKIEGEENIEYRYQIMAYTTASNIIFYRLISSPENMTIDNDGLISWIPERGDAGEYEIAIEVRTNENEIAIQEYNLSINSINNSPTIEDVIDLGIEGNVQRYEIVAVDIDGDKLRYTLESGPEASEIDEDTGIITWDISAFESGEYNFAVSVSDPYGGKDSSEFNVILDINNPPSIISEPVFIAKVAELYFYEVEAVDPDGDKLSFSLLESPEGMTIDSESGMIEWIPTEKGEFQVIIRVEDGRGGYAEQTYTIGVSEEDENNPPSIISEPVTIGTVGEEYQYQLIAVDEDGDPLTYALLQAPVGMSINETALISWIPEESQTGISAVEVEVSDDRGGVAVQSYEIYVSEKEVNQDPQIISTPIYNGRVGLEYNYQLEAVDPDGDELEFALLEAPDTMLINSSTGLITWLPDEKDIGEHLIHIEVSDGKGGSSEQSYLLNIKASDGDLDTSRPVVNIVLSKEIADAGDVVSIFVESGDDVVSRELAINGEYITLDEEGYAEFTSSVPQYCNVEAWASNEAGYLGYDSRVLRFITDGELTTPTATIISPERDSVLKEAVEITGTVSSENGILAYYLEYSPKDRDEYIKFASGDNEVSDGVLGVFDTSLIRNGLYDIRLTVEDTAGNYIRTKTSYKVDGQMKVGNFTLSFNDLTIPVAGIPITINRTYDSRNRVKDDFGVGWSLDIQNIELSKSCVLGEHWEEISSTEGLFTTYSIVEKRPHYITVTYPNGQTEEFDMKLNPSSSQIIPIRYTTVSYEARSGSTSTLEALYDNNVIVQNGVTGTELYTYDLGIYNPERFRLTQSDGTVLIISQSSGLERIIDSNANEINFTENGITHSAGKSVGFTRDSEGRIIAISDPAGNIITYNYDYYGDLISVTDQEGNITRFTYNSSHGLLDIIDPRGVRATRNEYDDQGRLIAHIDANGNRIEYERSIGDKQEIVRDRLGNMTVYDYDSNGNILQETDALGNVKSYTYDSNNNKTSETDALGNTTNYTYDQNGNLLTREDALGNKYQYIYNEQNQLVTVIDPQGNVSSNEYDEKGNLIKIIDLEGNESSFSYDQNGNLTSEIDSLGNETIYTYDSSGNLTSEIDAAGNEISFNYDTNGNRIGKTETRTTSSGIETLVTNYEYDRMNRLIKTTYPDGSSTSTEYNSIGRKAVEINRMGDRTEYEYNQAGKLERKIYPDRREESYTYDEEGNRISSTDQAGKTTKYQYDALGRLVKTIFPDDSSIVTIYDEAGRVKKRIDELGNETSYTYDAVGNTTSVTDALGNTVEYEYNDLNQRVKMIDAKENVFEYEYNKQGLNTKTIFPDGTSSIIEYDAVGNKIAETDQAGLTTHYDYDELGRLVKVIDAYGNETSYNYDQAGNILTETDANGNTTSFEYNDMGQRVKRTLALGMSELYNYDQAGNLISKTDFNGDTISYQYDSRNRLVKKIFADGSIEEYTYTPTGHRDTIITEDGITSYEYDLRDKLIRKENPDGTEILYNYDLAGNKTSVTIPSGTTEYIYDELNRLLTVIDNEKGETNYSYDENGLRSAIEYPNGTITEYTYDGLNRLIELSNKDKNGTIISSYKYTLGDAGNRIKVEENNGRVVEYTYDDLYRLTEENIYHPVEGNNSITYTYDAVGNRLSKTEHGISIEYTYDDNNRLISEGDTIYIYDDNGNTIGKLNADGNITYSYDYQNRLVEVNAADSNIEYQYNTSGMRTKKIVDGESVKYLLDENRTYAQVLEERDANGNLIVSYTYGDDLISQKRDNTISYYHYDGLGSTRVLTDDSSTVTDRYSYDAFGELIARTGDTENNYLFTGEQYDPNLGFYYLRARYMNPAIGRFINRDVWEGSKYDPQSLHKYLYTKNNPVMFVDPSGEFYISVISTITSFSIRMKNYSISAFAYSKILYQASKLTVKVGIVNIKSLIKYKMTFNSQLIQYANTRYPKLVGRYHDHHIISKYICKHLGIPIEHATVRIPASVHQLITNSIKESFPFGKNFVMMEMPKVINELLRAYERILNLPGL